MLKHRLYMFISPYTKSVQCQQKQQVIYCPLLVKCWLSQKLGGEVWLTCSQEHNLILAIICQNSVHHNVSQGVVNFDTCEHRTTSERVDRAIHQRVESNKSDNFIREVFSGLDPWIICFAWALKLQKNHSWLVTVFSIFPSTSSTMEQVHSNNLLVCVSF